MALEANIPTAAEDAAAQAKAKAAAEAAKAKPAAPAAQPCKACKSKCAKLYEENKKKIDKAKENLTDQQKADLAKFQQNYADHQAQYQSVADQTGIPPELVAALHYRESSSNFNTYLAQGDPLGAPPVHVPNDGPTFQKGEWDKAAANILNSKGKKACQNALGITKDTKDRAALAAYAEGYNGTGYTDYHPNVNTPYVYSGTDQYSTGKYGSDGHFDANLTDQQLGTLPLVDSITPPDPPYPDSTLIPPKGSNLYIPAGSG
jgi:lysozyme family protein